MTTSSTRPSVGTMIYGLVAVTLASYFTFAAVQGDYGVFRQVEIAAEAEELTAERDRLALELAEIENRTRRLSDEFLDIDLLDEQARSVLGYVRADEVVIQ